VHFIRALEHAISDHAVQRVLTVLELGLEIEPFPKPGIKTLLNALVCAIKEDQPEILQFLLDRGADPNFYLHAEGDDLHCSLITLALLSGTDSSFQLLLAAGACAFDNSDSLQPLQIAVWFGKESLVQQLHAVGANPNDFWGDPDCYDIAELGFGVEIRRDSPLSLAIL
jgi:ankyrin repeat protein